MPFQIIKGKTPEINEDLMPAGYDEDSVRGWYKSAFIKAAGEGAESIRVPFVKPFRVALSEVEAFLESHDMTVYLVVPDEARLSPSQDCYKDIDDYISRNYTEKPKKVRAKSSGFFQKAAKSKASDKYAEEAAVCMDSMPMVSGRSLEDVVNDLDKTFMELVFSFADEKGMTDVEVQKRANLDRKAFSKLKCGTTKNPSKGTALALAVALRLSLDDTKDLLSRAGFALSPCSRQDVIVQYFIEHEAYDIYEINMALFEHGEPILGMQAV